MRYPGTAVAVGVLLGVLDLVAQTNLSYPWANLANSPAIWGLVAVAIGVWVVRPVAAAAIGTATLVVAILAYYVSASVGLGDDLSNATGGTAAYWYTGGVGVGALGGLAGAWIRSGARWTAVLGSAFPVALAWSEATVQYAGADDRSGWNANTSTAVLLVLIGLAIAVVLTPRLVRRLTLRDVAAFCGLIAVLTLIGHLAYRAVGLQGFGS